MEINNNNYAIKTKQAKVAFKQQLPTQPANNQIQNSLYAPVPSQNGAMVNSALRAQALAAPIMGYKELKTFSVPYLDKGKLYQLDNGQKVVIIPKPGPTTIRTFVRVGSFNEPDKIRGISHYIEHNLFNGSQNLAPGEFVKRVNDMGSDYNASTDFSNTNYFIASPLHSQKDLENIVGMHADMIENPTFVQNMLDKEKGPVISEIQMYEDNPNDRAENMIIKNLFNIKADYQGLVAGSVDNIKNVTRDDVVNYYNKWYTPDNMTTVLVGDVNPDDAIKLISKNFKSKKPAIAPAEKHYENLTNSLTSPKRVDMRDKTINTVSVKMGFVGPKNNDIRGGVATEAMLCGLFGYDNSIMEKNLRAFNTHAGGGLCPVSSKLDDPQVISLQSSFNPGQEEDGLKTIYSSIQEIANEPVNDTELKIIKNKLKNQIAAMSEHSMGITEMVGQSLSGQGMLESYTEKEKIIDTLTAADIQNAARQFLDLNKVSIAMIHPADQKIGEQQPAKPTAFKGRIVSFGSSATTKPKTTNAVEYDLRNNTRLVLNDDPYASKTSIDFEFKADKMMNTKPGVPDVLRLMLDDGNALDSKEFISNYSDENNFSIMPFVSPDKIGAAVDTANDKAFSATEMMKEILLQPNLSPQKFENAKKEYKNMLLSMQEHPVDKIMETLYPDSPMGHTKDAALKALDTMTLQDVKDLYYNIISNSQAKAVVTGPLTKTPGLTDKILGSFEHGLPSAQKYHYSDTYQFKPLDKSVVFAKAEPRNQAHIMQAFKVKESGNIKDHASLVMLNQILGGGPQSRLFQDLRETQKLAYRVNSKYSSNGTAGTLTMEIKTSTKEVSGGQTVDHHENIQKSLDGFKLHINKLKDEKVPQNELDAAKLAIKSDIIYATESAGGKTDMLHSGLNTAYGTKYQEELLKAVDSLTADDLQKAAQVFFNQPAAVSLIASEDAITGSKDYLSTLGEVKQY